MANPKASGRVAGAGGGAQHVDLFRKLNMRRQLLRGLGPGAAYVPFLGDGDVAMECYTDRHIFGADLDPARVETAVARFTEAKVTSTCAVGDCDVWPFPLKLELPPFAVADLDSYSYPYHALRSFWNTCPKAGRVAIFGTDGQRQGMARNFTYTDVRGQRVDFDGLASMRKVYNRYWIGHVLPYVAELVAPAVVKRKSFYLRGMGMLYWGVTVHLD